MTRSLKSAALRIILEDKLRMWVAKHGAALAAVPRLATGLRGDRLAYFHWLMLEHRLAGLRQRTAPIKRALPGLLESVDRLLEADANEQWSHLVGARSIVLRPPSWTQGRLAKGVLLIKFTETFRVVHRNIDIERLMEYFHIVLEPSWSGYCLPEILLWARYKDPVIVQASEKLDREFLEDLGTNLVPIDIGASDWVDYRIFRPLGSEKRFDAIYVANLNPIKRVNVFVRAINRIVRHNSSFRAAVALSKWGGDQNAFEQLLQYYGVTRNVEVFMSQTQEQLNVLLNESRVSVLLSRKEGSNKTLFESMFAGTPVLLLRDNIGVNKSYINDETGLLVDEAELPDVMTRFASRDHRFRPREWAMANISPERSVEKLESVLAVLHAKEQGPLYVKVNTPEATYLDADIAAKMPRVSVVLDLFARERLPRESRDDLEKALRDLFTRAK